MRIESKILVMTELLSILVSTGCSQCFSNCTIEGDAGFNAELKISIAFPAGGDHNGILLTLNSSFESTPNICQNIKVNGTAPPTCDGADWADGIVNITFNQTAMGIDVITFPYTFPANSGIRNPSLYAHALGRLHYIQAACEPFDTPHVQTGGLTSTYIIYIYINIYTSYVYIYIYLYIYI